jgi:hypothetical protein
MSGDPKIMPLVIQAIQVNVVYLNPRISYAHDGSVHSDRGSPPSNRVKNMSGRIEGVLILVGAPLPLDLLVVIHESELTL